MFLLLVVKMHITLRVQAVIMSPLVIVVGIILVGSRGNGLEKDGLEGLSNTHVILLNRGT